MFFHLGAAVVVLFLRIFADACHHGKEENNLFVELASRSIDMIYKLNTFMMSGVGEYWLDDPENRQVTIYRLQELQIAGYDVVRMGEVAGSKLCEGLSVALDELWEMDSSK